MTHRRSSPAEIYLWIWGGILLVLGIGSLVVHPDFAVGAGVTEERLFGVFETNGWHGVAGLALGVLSVAAAASGRWVVDAALAVGLGGGVIPALLFFAAGDGGVAIGLIPVDLLDAVTLHLVPGIAGVLCAWWSRRGGVPAPGAASGSGPGA